MSSVNTADQVLETRSRCDVSRVSAWFLSETGDDELASWTMIGGSRRRSVITLVLVV